MRLPPAPNRLPLIAHPTPLTRLSRLVPSGPALWVKRDDLTGTALSGNKLRKLEFVLAAARAAGADTLITCGGVQSNHCRATALLAAEHGLRCELILRGEPPAVADGNLLLAQLAGAEVDYVPAARWQALPELLQARSEAVWARGGRPYVISTGASDEVGLWGYIEGGRELLRDCARAGFTPDAVCVATGSGGTHLGLCLAMAEAEPGCRVRGYAVCDSRRYFQEKACQDLAAFVARYGAVDGFDPASIDVEERYRGPAYAVADPEVWQTIGRAARQEGLVLDPVYTGKALHGTLRDLTEGPLADCRNVVFVHTGGIFGLFPQREQWTTSSARGAQ